MVTKESMTPKPVVAGVNSLDCKVITQMLMAVACL